MILTIKKVPTVVSNYQEENSEKGFEGCGRNCLGKCCIPVLRNHQKNNLVYVSCTTDAGTMGDRMIRGLFRYDVTACDTKIIPGRYGFIAQLNKVRHQKKRLTEFRVDKDKKKCFSGLKKALTTTDIFFPVRPPITADSNSSSVVAINVSPIEYGHVLMIPQVLDCLPQRIDRGSFLLALHMAKEAADPFFRVGYNSLGAFATINHLHFQAYYLAAPFPVEKAPTRRIMTLKSPQDEGVIVSQLQNYPVRGLVFEGENTVQDLSDSVASSCIFLQNNNIPFNVLIADCGRRIFLFPQLCEKNKHAEKARPGASGHSS
ncbi:hypothetical protein NC653_018105 [Populus alba x Populus x berolinensis]|uniref:GDP-D-glucose phosphorylase 1 n=1 Tax=Populus alba x Populus x berolinensis TaxID=444605 RepID=A0AAD6W227_9ROSI|nr:hypothetical protein NC653_018105 [Populus alba x Populus x berolinensis]